MSAIEAVPAFVTSGLANVGSNGEITYRSEADLRDTLALHWWVAGAESVRTEVKVPDCGRIDVLVNVGPFRLLYEVKKRIDTPTQARQAFQQAHAYTAYLTTGIPLMRTFVAAAHYSYPAAVAAERAYEGITGQLFVEALQMATDYQAEFRLPFAERRSVLLGRLADMARGSYLGAARVVEDRALREMTESS